MSASYMRKYGTGTGADIYINIPKAASANHAVGADWSPAAGDVKISKDGGAAANVGTLPTAVAMGNSAIWKFVFTDAELQAAFVSVTIADSATKAVDDTGFSIETYGNASALHAFDLDTASTAQTGDSFAIVNSGTHGNSALKTLIDAVDNFVDAEVAAIFDRIGAPAGASVSADIAAVKSDSAAILVDTGTTLDGRIPAALVGGRMDSSLGAVAAGVDLSATMKASVNAEVLDVLNTDTFAEPAQGAPAATATLVAKIGHLYKAYRNRKTQTSTTWSLYNDDAVTVDHKSTVSDDGTTATRGEIATGS